MLVGLAAVAGLVPHRRAGRVRAGVGTTFGLVGIGGSIAGSALNRRIDPDVLLLGFSVLVCVAAWRMVTGCPTCTQVGEQRAILSPSASSGAARSHLTPSVAALVVASGTGVGFLTGLFGVGGGFVIVPTLTLVLKLSMPEAIGTSLLVIAINAAVGLSTRLATTSIDWEVTGPFAVAAIVGVLVGGRLSVRLDPHRTLRGFAVLLVLVAIYTAVQAVRALT